MKAYSLSTLTMTVADIERSTAFYTQAFGCIVLFDQIFPANSYSQLGSVSPSAVRMVTLRLGDEYIELIQYLDLEALPVPADSRSHDLWFQHIAIVVSDIDLAYERLRSFDIRPISSGPQTIPADNPNAGGVRAFKFRDFDGHSLELIWFPTDKRRDKWDSPGDRLFLGIDHSAIAVSNTAQSLAFYRDLLGLEESGQGHNTGPVQAELDGVPGADVKLTSLQTSQPKIGLELLDYQQPGRPRPQTWQINDLSHRHLILEVDDLNTSLGILKQHGIETTALQIVNLPDPYRYTAGLLIKDPDGHSLLLVVL